MLYILPPPSSPAPPSPWTTILCNGGSNGAAENSGESNRGSNTSLAALSSSSSTSSLSSSTSSSSLPRCTTRGNACKVWLNAIQTKNQPAKRSSHKVKLRPKRRDCGDHLPSDNDNDDEDSNSGKSLSECYFAGKGTAVVMPPSERLAQQPSELRGRDSDIQQHLQSMFYLLRPEETLKMAVKLESAHPGRTRYLVVVSCNGRQDSEESCLLGIDCNQRTTVGLVLRVLADTAITLDGDGGFSVSVCGRQHIFKPVSVQAMWSALQTLHKVSQKAREQNFFLNGVTHEWVSYYEQNIQSDRSCLNEWHAMDNLESRRPPSPDSLRHKPREREETERVIRSTLKEIMMSVDLDEVTSKHIRTRLEELLDMDLGEYKPFIDQEMLVILGQMDEATEIFPHVFLGSEWNASNLEELNKNGVCHILNVTREIDNFFPGMFHYLNVRVYDDEKTDLLKHWDNTFKYITSAKNEGSKVLVHCKMGVSRSASVVIAYAMKAYNWDFKKALDHVRQKRNCIKPNSNFIAQLETYQGMLDAMKNREKLQRSKSETNLKVKSCKSDATDSQSEGEQEERQINVANPINNKRLKLLTAAPLDVSGAELSHHSLRPKSWSPDNITASNLFDLPGGSHTSQSLDRLSVDSPTTVKNDPVVDDPPPSVIPPAPLSTHEARSYHNINVRMPCGNGLAYSVSQNKIVHLPQRQEMNVASVRHRVNELESQTGTGNGWSGKQPIDKRGLVLNLTSQFENNNSSPVETSSVANTSCVKREPWESERYLETNFNAMKEKENCINSKQSSRNSVHVIRCKAGDISSDRVDYEELKGKKKCVKNTEIGRQNSWSSYDSAGGLGYQGEIARQNSWGSGDSKVSHNSTWDPYDVCTSSHLGNEYSENNENLGLSNCPLAFSSSQILGQRSIVTGTIKRTRMKSSNEIESVNSSYPDSNTQAMCSKSTEHYASTPSLPSLALAIPGNPLTASQPNITSVRQESAFLENFNQPTTRRCISVEETVRLDNSDSQTGLVKNLKKEFEAKSNLNDANIDANVNMVITTSQKCINNNERDTNHNSEKGQSLPSSPVSERVENKSSPAACYQDLSVRKLVGKYEVAKNTKDRPRFISESDKKFSNQPPIPPSRKSSLDIHNNPSHNIMKHSTTVFNNLKNNSKGAPSVVVKAAPTPSVVSSVTKKQQQGKTHPLARLTLKQRHTNPIYNSL
ncbi:LOW QUALITY PROTEIN: uncharacterized protein ssh [Bemisia tabaci]|uniref:LOW QUALITY PROTEIN: uncharacterized protein ssh n=1 Tax=Bemisia tabaci TaxID=7038 RepID=UPI003B28BAE6